MAVEGTDRTWNESIYHCLQADLLCMQSKNWTIFLLGDFNGHLQELDGADNVNGTKLQSFAMQNNLIIGNLMDTCDGKVTWSRGEQSSTIDYALIQDSTWYMVTHMTVDEDELGPLY